MSLPIIQEIGSFIDSLKKDLPDIFKPRQAPLPIVVPGSKEEAKRVFAERTAFWAARIGVSYGRITIRDQRSLWGSCTREGNLNYNWRLITAPPEILDYVVIHELCHRLEMSHSPAFWGHVARFCPDHKAHRKWLRLNGRALKGGAII